MKTIEVKKLPVNYEDFVKRSALESDFETLIDESCILVDADTKEVIAVYKELDLPDDKIMWALNNIKYDTSTRSAGLKTISRIFGYSPRVALRKDFCSSTSLAVESPKQHKIICDYGRDIAKLYEEHRPETYKKHLKITDDKVLDTYRLPETPFTSGIVNKSNPLKYHFDSGNFKGVYSCMAVFKKDVEGGYISLPEYGVGFTLRHNSVFMFDGQSALHGVTPIKKLSPHAVRYSVVYYSLQQLWNCLPLNEELARIRKLKAEREMKRFRRLQGEDS